MGTTSWSALAASVIAATPLAAMPAGPPAPPPALAEPGPAPLPAQPRSRPAPPWMDGAGGALQGGGLLVINGRSQRARWLWQGDGDSAPRQLWLPLEVLQGQLGVSARNRRDGVLLLEWFGVELQVPPDGQRSLDDEVAVEISELLGANGVVARRQGERLALTMPLGRVRQLRDASLAGGRRLVLDLEGPALVRDDDSTLLLGLQTIDPAMEARLGALGLRSRRSAEGLLLSGVRPTRVFSLGDPPRLVIDLPGTGTADAATRGPSDPGAAATAMDPRLRALLGRELIWQRQLQDVGGGRVLLTSVSLDPRTAPLDLRTLSRRQSMEGLSSLPGLARSSGALVAVNGGYFNRVRRLPLGALRDQGRWLSGPILGRGAMGWETRQLPRFGRLRLDAWVSDSSGRRLPLVALNSGWVQRGISLYTGDWGAGYRPISGNESALLLRNGVVQWRVGAAGLGAGVALAAGDELLVARGGAELPWAAGERLRIESVASDPLGSASNVIGGGPLLLQNGRVVLDGGAEGFSAAFLRQAAPRTVVGSDGQKLWLITLEGSGDDPGPTLAETAWLLQRMGLRDALNLDGGSSTGLIMGGIHSVKGRGVGGAVHHGLGLVPADNSVSAGTGGF